MQSLGTERFVGITVARAGHQFARGITQLGLPLSAKKTAFTSSSTSLAKQLTASWDDVGFKRKMHTRNVGVDTANGRRRRTTIADKRLKQSFRRAARLQQLRKAG
eukprot:6986002-Heterocapsa_arctica.AAC.1